MLPVYITEGMNMAGKKKLPDTKYSERVEFFLTPPVAERFRKHCKELDISPALWLRQCIEITFPPEAITMPPEAMQSLPPVDMTVHPEAIYDPPIKTRRDKVIQEQIENAR